MNSAVALYLPVAPPAPSLSESNQISFAVLPGYLSEDSRHRPKKHHSSSDPKDCFEDELCNREIVFSLGKCVPFRARIELGDPSVV
jgi:hypothetical protein